MKAEQEHLVRCRELIGKNVGYYEQQSEALRRETRDLYAAVAAGSTELYERLIVAREIQEHSENQLRKNRAAFLKPYFGRIDYLETDSGVRERLYIGKNGVTKDKTEVVVVDWRAPVTALYYENELGPGSYEVPGVGEIDVDLERKRTFDLNDGKLIGFYDNDTAASDELLVKYLSQNKDAILGDIISTIQKEQNRIIRQVPYRNIIVQGVAGSGKTTVCMHRISHILYNYEERFRPNEFCIIGSNDMLLGYITSGLPELDVRNVRQKRMDLFFIDLLEKDWKKKFRLDEIPVAEAYKSRMAFVKELDAYLDGMRRQKIGGKPVRDRQLGVILSAENIENTINENPALSLVRLYRLLNERIRSRIKFLIPSDEVDFFRSKSREYSGYYKQQPADKDIVRNYLAFIDYLEDCRGQSLPVTRERVRQGEFDVYDIAALVLIRRRLTERKASEEFSQIFIDEAQDFGPMVYYVLKQALGDCYFTVMGDVSQNINYETGMNGWEDLKTEVFDPAKTEFQLLAKSYRNTIEISEFAGRILEKASFGQYKIEPVIRHGAPVGIHRMEESGLAAKTASLIREIQGRGYDTIAVICRRAETARQLSRDLADMVEIDASEDFTKGVMVLPVNLTKGLEFDAVILWNPDEENYPGSEAEAKLLYVAVTRALHELHIVCGGALSGLIV